MLSADSGWLAALQAALMGLATPWAIALALAATTLLLEDLAIAAGVSLATQGLIGWPLSLAAVGGGIAVGDIGLYGLGLAATRVPWLRQRLVGPRTLWARDALARRLPSAVLLARVIPGLRLLTYTACGFVRVPLLPFCAWVLLAVSLWTAGLYALSVAIGQALAQQLGLPPALAVALPIALLAVAVPLWRWLRAPAVPPGPAPRHSTAPEPQPGEPMSALQQAPPDLRPSATPHQGMPPFEQDGPPLSFFEFWPMWAFYPPVMAYAAWLMLRYRGLLLPTVANPSVPGGGFFGESKADILALAMAHVPEWVAPFVALRRAGNAPGAAGPAALAECEAALATLAAAGLALPVVAKPDLGCRGAGVKLVRSRADLQAYLLGFPAGATLLLQRLVPFEGEAGIFYCRRPGQAHGRVVSITLKYFPHVIGDGRRTLRQLIADDPRAGPLQHLYLRRHSARLDSVPPAGEAIRLAFAGSHSRGAIFRNGSHLVTPEMEAGFDAIARRLPEFHFGRFDIRFERFADVQQGRGFTIVEINGAGAESTHIWDRKTGLLQAWRDLMRQYRWLFEIGHANRARGFQPMRWADFLRDYRREKALTPLYPATD